MKKIITAILSITGILNTALYAAVSGPYTVDAYTLHLYHFDGNANDAVATNPINLTLAYGATVTTTSYTGFGTMLNTYEGTSGTSNMPIAYVNEKAVNNFFGTDGAFTFEAIVKPAVDTIPNNMQIISGDDDSDQTYRGWLFRVTTAKRLEFTKLTGTQATFSEALPTTGEQAWGLEEFHVAVTYNGLENTPNNLKFYWTRLNSSASQAVLLASFQMVTDLSISPAVDFAVGNEGRDNTNENFEGLLDEVRISSIARAPDQMLIIPSIPRPAIVTHPSDAIIREPQIASFQTVFESESTPVVKWFKVDSAGDIELTSADPNISMRVTYNSGTQQYTAVLDISDTTTLDTGSYYCQVNNDSNLPRNSNTAELVVQGLVAHWTLDQNDLVSGQYLDVIGGYDATAQGTPTFVAGADDSVNSAVLITPTTGWATVDEFNPGLTGAMTVSVWVNWQETSVSSDDLVVTSLPDGNSVSMDDGLKSANQWQQVCAVFDGTTGKVYINGKLRVQGNYLLPDDMTSLLDIGSTDGGSESFNGYMDDLRIYNYAITDTQVADIYYAMTGLGVCRLEYASQFDYTGPDGQPDCTVDIYDLRVFANGWLAPYDYPDFADLARNWLSCGLYPDCNP